LNRNCGGVGPSAPSGDTSMVQRVTNLVGIMADLKIYTRKGDDGTTGLYYGGRVQKNDPAPAAYGDVDEAQSAIGLARAVARAEQGIDCEVDRMLIALEKDLWVLMADLATDTENRSKLTPGMSQVTEEMVAALEPIIDDLTSRFELPKEFVVPGQTVLSERTSIAAAAEGSLVVAYLNRLSDLLWTVARWQEHGSTLRSREA
jgi:cob(I)alamin adenosyltransferase